MSTSELMVAIHPGETYTLEEFMTCHEGKMGLVSVYHVMCIPAVYVHGMFVCMHSHHTGTQPLPRPPGHQLH